MSLYFDKEGYSRNPSAKGTQVNHHSGRMNDGELINKGRGPTKGNMDIERKEEMGEETPRRAPSSVPDIHPKGAYGKAQYRGVGGTQVKKPSSMDKINYGRGPTKGNKC